jgi:tRNA dimethylallyltransferase
MSEMLNASCLTKNKTLIVLVGPTAVGKTRIAIQLAQHFDTLIISADSRQFYRELKIGTAAPDQQELAMAPHYFVGHLSIRDYYNVSRFENDVLAFVDKAFASNNPLIMTGGSGLYVDAVTKGIDELPDPDPGLRKEIEQWHSEKGIHYLQQKLQELDPDYYAAVDRNNPSRLKRAIEICLSTGKTYSSLRTNTSRKRYFDVIKIGLNLPRHELFERIGQRTDEMISSGLVQEVESLATHRKLNALNTVGYKEIFQYLDGKMTLERAVEKIKTNTRRYAKRQLTWFKRDEEITWFSPKNPEAIISFIESRL